MVGRTTNLNRDLSAKLSFGRSTGPPPAGISALQICFAQLNIPLPLSASNQIANLMARSFLTSDPSRAGSFETCIVLLSVQNTETITFAHHFWMCLMPYTVGRAGKNSHFRSTGREKTRFATPSLPLLLPYCPGRMHSHPLCRHPDG